MAEKKYVRILQGTATSTILLTSVSILWETSTVGRLRDDGRVAELCGCVNTLERNNLELEHSNSPQCEFREVT